MKHACKKGYGMVEITNLTSGSKSESSQKHLQLKAVVSSSSVMDGATKSNIDEFYSNVLNLYLLSTTSNYQQYYTFFIFTLFKFMTLDLEKYAT